MLPDSVGTPLGRAVDVLRKLAAGEARPVERPDGRPTQPAPREGTPIGRRFTDPPAPPTDADRARRPEASGPPIHEIHPETWRSFPDRAHFLDELERAINVLDESDDGVALLLVSLNGVQMQVGGTWEDVTPALVLEVGERLCSARRFGETVGLLREHEFGILIRQCDERSARGALERVAGLVELSFVTDRGEALVHASFGMALTRSPSEQVTALLRRADLTRYSGAISDEADDDAPAAAGSLGAEAALIESTGSYDTDRSEPPPRRTPGTGEMSALYRPIYDLAAGDTVAVQVMPRWRAADDRFWAPLEIASSWMTDDGTDKADRWLLESTCQRIRMMSEQVDHLDLSARLPLSPRQLDSVRVVEDVATALRESGIAPDRLVFELPEAVARRETRIGGVLVEGLRALEVKLSVSDFSSDPDCADFARHVEADELVVQCPFEPGNSSTTSTSGLHNLVKLARMINVEVVVDGVNTFSQLRQVLAAGVRLAQGDVLSRAMDFDRLMDALSGGISADFPAQLA